MDKILEFKKGKIFNEDTKMYRFQCDCLSAADAMDVTVESKGKNNEEKYFIICMNLLPLSFWERLKDAFGILKGKWTWREFVIRQNYDEQKALSDIINPDKKFSELP